ncbi:hypothetical protein J4404_01310 [Candidatus Woesearchaeota archaeon]|nr:hypothetical protein [Candidatus Woesearchaeota archaeon]
MASLPKFKGKHPVTIEADILKGPFGKAVNKEVQKEYGNYKVINKVGYNPKTNQVEGSNPFYVTAVNQVIMPEGLRTSTVDDIKLIRQLNLLDLKGCYEDIGFIIRGLEGDNKYFAKKLMEGKQKFPVTVNLSDLELIKDDQSEYGLAFKLKDTAKIMQGDLAEYKGVSALSRLCLGRILDLNSYDDDLGDSFSDGRVVTVHSLVAKILSNI